MWSGDKGMKKKRWGKETAGKDKTRTDKLRNIPDRVSVDYQGGIPLCWFTLSPVASLFQLIIPQHVKHPAFAASCPNTQCFFTVCSALEVKFMDNVVLQIRKHLCLFWGGTAPLLWPFIALSWAPLRGTRPGNGERAEKKTPKVWWLTQLIQLCQVPRTVRFICWSTGFWRHGHVLINNIPTLWCFSCVMQKLSLKIYEPIIVRTIASKLKVPGSIPVCMREASLGSLVVFPVPKADTAVFLPLAQLILGLGITWMVGSWTYCS